MAGHRKLPPLQAQHEAAQLAEAQRAQRVLRHLGHVRGQLEGGAGVAAQQVYGRGRRAGIPCCSARAWGTGSGVQAQNFFLTQASVAGRQGWLPGRGWLGGWLRGLQRATI